MEVLQGVWNTIVEILQNSGYAQIFTGDGYKFAIMLAIACGLLYLGIKKGFEPLLMIPIAFGMLLANLPGANLAVQYHDIQGFYELFKNMIENNGGPQPGLIDFLYLGVKLGIYPPLIFLGIGAMTDFSPLIANPKSFILGAAAQFGIFFTYVVAIVLGFTATEAGSIAIIGGADGPTAIFVTSQLAPHLLGTIAVAAQNELMNIITIMLGLSVGATTSAETFLSWNTLLIVGLGLVAFMVATASGVLFGKLMYVFTKGKINPLIGSAGVSAVPMAARVSQNEGQKENPSNYLLMHAMGPNVAGVIGSAVAAGVLLTIIK